MPNFEKGAGYSREVYDKTAENEAILKTQIAGAKTADEMMAIAMKLKEVEGNKKELDNEAYDEAITEDQERAKKELEIASQKDDSESSEKAKQIMEKIKEGNIEKVTVENGKNSKELVEQYKDLNNLAGVNLGTPEYAQKVEELLQLAKKRGNYTQLEGQASEDAHEELAENLEKRLKANTEIMIQLEREVAGKITEMLDAPKVLELRRVKEKEYKERILDDLKKNIPQDKEVMVLMLKDKIGSFDDKESPAFVYGKENVGEATKVINKWVDNIDSKHYMLPALATEYFFSIMDENQFEKAVENPALVADENLRKAVEKYKSALESEKSNEEANRLLKNLFDARDLDPFWNRVSGEQEESANRLRELFKGLDQSALAQKFFDDTIGQRIDNNKQAYMVYGLLKGTEFADKFKELESARLKRAGFAEFSL